MFLQILIPKQTLHFTPMTKGLRLNTLLFDWNLIQTILIFNY